MRLLIFLGFAVALLTVVGTVPSQTTDCLDITTSLSKDLPKPLQFPEVDSVLPLDVTFATDKTIENDQKAFDLFSWDSFIALNWPAGVDGNPLPGKMGDNASAPRLWETYIAASQVFKIDGSKPDPWGGENSFLRTLATRAKVPEFKKGQRVLFAVTKNSLSDFLQAGFGNAKFPPIADVNGMYTFYEIHLNRSLYDYIVTFELYNKDGQTTFLAKTAPANLIAFPQGSIGEKKQGAIELKAMWKQLGTDDDRTKFYTIEAIRIDPKTLMPSPKPLPFGLVGLHIVTRTETAPQWIWSTFEHVDNAPDVGETKLKIKYNFNKPKNPQPAGGFGFRPPTNDPVDNPTTPTQITRVLNNNLINAPWTQGLNQAMQAKLKGTVWENYRLISTQWPSPTGQFIPCNLTNSVAETYIQGDGFSGSCMRCHARAKTSGKGPNGQTAAANFSYLLQMAKPRGK